MYSWTQAILRIPCKTMSVLSISKAGVAQIDIVYGWYIPLGIWAIVHFHLHCICWNEKLPFATGWDDNRMPITPRTCGSTSVLSFTVINAYIFILRRTFSLLVKVTRVHMLFHIKRYKHSNHYSVISLDCPPSHVKGFMSALQRKWDFFCVKLIISRLE